jgi:hypothetical protein
MRSILHIIGKLAHGRPGLSLKGSRSTMFVDPHIHRSAHGHDRAEHMLVGIIGKTRRRNAEVQEGQHQMYPHGFPSFIWEVHHKRGLDCFPYTGGTVSPVAACDKKEKLPTASAGPRAARCRPTAHRALTRGWQRSTAARGA